MATGKKPRSDSKVAGLAPEVRAEIVRRLGEDNQSYTDVCAWLLEAYGVSVSVGALCNWASVHGWRESAAQARAFAQAVRAEAKASGDYDEAILAHVQERAYLLARAKKGSVQDLATLAGIIGDSVKLRLKEREVGLAERRVALLEKKAAQADEAAGIVGDTKLTEAEKAQRLRGLFGMG